MSNLLAFILIAIGATFLASLAGALLGTAVWIYRLRPEEWHWMQQAELERRREEAAFREAWRSTVRRRFWYYTVEGFPRAQGQ